MKCVRPLLAVAPLLLPVPLEAHERVETETGPMTVETFADGLEHPWGIAFLPDGSALVTERAGNLRHVDGEGELSRPISGVPRVVAAGQGGLLDVALHPEFSDNRMVYLTFSEPGEDGTNGTAVARGVLSAGNGALENVEVIFRQEPKVRSNGHFGSRLQFDNDGLLWVTLGERQQARYRVLAQDLRTHLGKVIRIRDDGSVPDGNPFIGRNDARPEIWSWGHRNPQGMDLHPETGEVWIHEHGPRGGDELQAPEAGMNYGWPEFSYGREYSGGRIGSGESHAPQFVEPFHQWTPSIAPSGLAFYDGEAIPAWRGDILVGALAAQKLVRLDVEGGRVVGSEDLLAGLGKRIRDVEVGPDGAVYLLTDESNGEILRLTTAE